MPRVRGAGLLLVLLCGILIGQVLLWPTAGRAEGLPAPPDCADNGSKGATGRAGIVFEHRGRTYTKATSDVTITVPMSWKRADKLLFGTASEGYRPAMRCLVRGDQRFDTRREEWRAHEPVVKPGAKSVTIRVRAHTWVDQRRTLLVGPWVVTVGSASWKVRFAHPRTVGSVVWQGVTVDPGAPGVTRAIPRAAQGEGTHGLRWNSAAPERPITVWIEPSWPRSWSAQDDSAPFGVINATGTCFGTSSSPRHCGARQSCTAGSAAGSIRPSIAPSST